jgi:hypothetical protein
MARTHSRGTRVRCGGEGQGARGFDGCGDRTVAQEVTQLLAEALETPKPLSILDLKGLGKEHWRAVDAAEHVEKERASWD